MAPLGGSRVSDGPSAGAHLSPSGTASARARAARLALPASRPSPDTVVRTNFGGLDSACGSCADAPPDVQIAAGPTYLVELVNLGGEIVSKSGSVASTFSLYDYPFFLAPSDVLSDPQVLYDNATGRYFATILDVTTRGFQIAASMSSDPRAGFWDYNITGVPTGEFPDQPMLGVSDGVVGVGANDFSVSGTTFYGGQFWVLNKSNLTAGLVTYYAWWGPTCGSLCTYPATENPARSLSSTSIEYFLSSGTGSGSILGLYAATGIPPAPVNLVITTFAVSPLTLAPAARQAGTTNSLDTGDGRVLEAVWKSGALWAALDDGCLPTGDTVVRSCIRLIDYDTTAGSVVVDKDWGSPGTYYYYPALNLDARGDMSVIAGVSTATSYPGLEVWGQAFNAPGTLQPGVNLTGSLPSGPIQDASCSGTCRLGDYFGAATDPNGTTVWLAGEYGAAARYWSTYIGAAVTTPTFGVTLVASRPSVDLTQSVTLTATASLGTPPYSYSWSGLPPGCAGANADTLTCTPTAAGSYSIDVTVTDSAGGSSTSAPLSLIVYTVPIVAPPILSRATADVGQTVSMSTVVTGGSGSYAYFWNGPLGCFGLAASLTCAPRVAGIFNVTVLVADSNGMVVSSPYTPLQVSPTPTVNLSLTPSPVLQGQALTVTATVTGGLGSYRYAWTSLPTGCTGPTDTDTFSCVPTTAATYAVNVTVTDWNGVNAYAQVNLVVQPSVLGLPSTEGYSVIAGIAAVVIVVVALLLARRRRKNPPPAVYPPPTAAPLQPPALPGAPQVPQEPAPPPASPPPLPPSPPPPGG